jgi:chromosome partitioning protein
MYNTCWSYNLNLDLLGILPVLQQNGSELDLDVINDAIASFVSVNMFNTHIKQMHVSNGLIVQE